MTKENLAKQIIETVINCNESGEPTIALEGVIALLDTLEPPPVLRSASEDEQCPMNDYTVGEPQGTCWGDGHYECKNCIHYREDFKRLGQDFIDFAHQQQGTIRFVSIA